MSTSSDIHGSPTPLEEFGRYRLLRPLAAGGMAEVHIAEMRGPLGFRRRVALKRVLPHLRVDPDFVQSFVDEARVGGMLVHPNIVQILDFDLVDGLPYLAMEYVEGGNFTTLLERARRLRCLIPFEALVALFLQASRGLQFAHEARDADGRPLRLVHRDLKPSNLLMGRDGLVKIADFGIAKAASNQRQTQPDTLKGSLPYMSPEQAGGDRELTAASDLFSMGSVLYELATTERLFRADTPAGMIGAVIRGPRPEQLERMRALPPAYRGLEPIVQRLLRVEPDERFPGAGALVKALEALDAEPMTAAGLSAFAREWLEPGTEGTTPASRPARAVVELNELDLPELTPDETWTFGRSESRAAEEADGSRKAGEPPAEAEPEVEWAVAPVVVSPGGVEAAGAPGPVTNATPAMHSGLPPGFGPAREMASGEAGINPGVDAGSGGVDTGAVPPTLDVRRLEERITAEQPDELTEPVPDTELEQTTEEAEVPALEPGPVRVDLAVVADVAAKGEVDPPGRTNEVLVASSEVGVAATPAASPFLERTIREQASSVALAGRAIEKDPDDALRSATPVAGATERGDPGRTGVSGKSAAARVPPGGGIRLRPAGVLLVIAVLALLIAAGWGLVRPPQSPPVPGGAIADVLSRPEGIEVKVDGAVVGVTPLRLRVEPRLLEVEVHRAGQPPRRWKGQITPDEHRIIDFQDGSDAPRSWTLTLRPSERGKQP